MPITHPRGWIRARRPLTAVIIGTALLAAACGSDPSPGAREQAEAQPIAAPETPAELAKLTVAVAEDVGPVNIFASHEEPLTELVYDKLLSPSPYVDDPQPWLATSVTAVDPSTWEVKLREDVTWHDGEPFTAADVEFTFNYFKEAPTGRWTHHVSEIPQIDVIEAVDDTTVRFECAFACPFLGRVTLADLPIIPAHVWGEVADPKTFTELPIGTGPYRLVSYSAESGYRFEANEDYFAGAPVVAELDMPIIEDPSAAFTALRTGEIDAVARGVAPELLDQFRGDDSIAVATTSPFQFLELVLNFERSPFDDPEVRLAMSRAVDRDELLDVVVLGQGRPSTTGYPHPDSPWTNPDLSTPTDPEEARDLLDEAGYDDTDDDGVRESADGVPLRFEIKVLGSEPTHVRAAELVADHLGEVGFDVSIKTQDAGAMGGLFKSRDFDASLGQMTAHGVADPTQFIMSHRSGYLWRSPDVAYPEWEALFEEWKAASTIEDRTEVSFRMQELFNSQPTSIPLLYPDENWAYRPDSYTGWVESPGYGIVHKWSFLPIDVGRQANAVTQVFGDADS